jgi:hypothetical protein
MGREPALARGGCNRAFAQAPRVVQPAEHQRGSAQLLIKVPDSADESARGLTLVSFAGQREPPSQSAIKRNKWQRLVTKCFEMLWLE